MTRGLRERGSILVGALWGAIVLATIALSLATQVRTELTAQARHLKAAEAKAIAQGGLAFGAALVEGSADSLPLDGTPLAFAFEGHSLTLRFSNEDGKIDLNRGAPVVLARLLDGPLKDNLAKDVDVAETVEAIVELRARQAIEQIADLRALPLFRDADFEDLSRYLTCHALSTKIDPRSAPREVLMAVPGLSAGDVERLLAARTRGGALPAIPGEAGLWLAERAPSVVRIEAEIVSGSAARARHVGVFLIERDADGAARLKALVEG